MTVSIYVLVCYNVFFWKLLRTFLVTSLKKLLECKFLISPLYPGSFTADSHLTIFKTIPEMDYAISVTGHAV
jgi:hypothetical protein